MPEEGRGAQGERTEERIEERRGEGEKEREGGGRGERRGRENTWAHWLQRWFSCYQPCSFFRQPEFRVQASLGTCNCAYSFFLIHTHKNLKPLGRKRTL